MIEENVTKIFSEIQNGNPYGEKITLVGATKMQTADKINVAISAGLKDIGENKVNEFCDKYDYILPCKRHFIGNLQTNKIKYILGKVDLYHSIGRMNLAEEINKRSENALITSNILLEVNIGKEETKGGFFIEELEDAYKTISKMSGLKVEGLMAMLPPSNNEDYLFNLAKQMREAYDNIKATNDNIRYLSMGMSGDYLLCIKAGSNMIRVGSGIFGKRDYQN